MRRKNDGKRAREIQKREATKINKHTNCGWKFDDYDNGKEKMNDFCITNEDD